MNADTLSREGEVLELASLAGHILLENGAEISRVEESMERIASYYGVDSKNFFVLSNGIFTTGRSSYAKVEFIPFKGAQLERVSKVNQISRDIENGKYSIAQARKALLEVREMKSKNPLVQILGSGVGSAGFCIIFGGSLTDSAAAFVVGLLLWAFVLFVAGPHLSKITGNILGGALATALCILLHKAGLGTNLGNMIIGSIIPLIPGVPFTNGIRDLANEDYIAGTTRLLDALMVFLSIAIGVSIAFLTDSWVEGSMMALNGMVTDSETSSIPVQIAASFLGTIGFAVLFGVPSKHYLETGAVAALGWALYLALVRFTNLSVPVSTFCASVFVVILSRAAARCFHAPVTVFMITGIFPMVPGGGLFWTTYFTISSQLNQSLSYGFLSIKITLAIVLAIVLVNELPSRLFYTRRDRRPRTSPTRP